MTPRHYTAFAERLADWLDREGLTVNRRDAYGNIFLKIGALHRTIRLGDAALDDRYHYRYNVTTTKRDRYDRETKQFYYTHHDFDDLVHQLRYDVHRAKSQDLRLQQCGV